MAAGDIEPSAKGRGGVEAEFDAFAADYDAALNKGISVSGEDKHYFIAGRVAFTAKVLRRLGAQVNGGAVMDFGCGTGSAFRELREKLGAGKIIGVDVSEAELAIAHKEHARAGDELVTPAAYVPDGTVAAAYSNGTFHHILLKDRPGACALVYNALRPGGVFALWENNPWNPGTRLVMKRIPFDRDAITLSVLETKRMLGAAGFEVVRSDFLFYFPRALGFLRWTEPAFRKVPMGAQYVVVGRKGSSNAAP